jgi:ribosomal protein S27E
MVVMYHSYAIIWWMDTDGMDAYVLGWMSSARYLWATLYFPQSNGAHVANYLGQHIVLQSFQIIHSASHPGRARSTEQMLPHYQTACHVQLLVDQQPLCSISLAIDFFGVSATACSIRLLICLLLCLILLVGRRSPQPFCWTRKALPQAQEIGAISQLLLHGRQVPWYVLWIIQPMCCSRIFFNRLSNLGCFNITTVFSHAQTVVLCSSCATVLCQPTGGRARLTEGKFLPYPQHDPTLYF